MPSSPIVAVNVCVTLSAMRTLVVSLFVDEDCVSANVNWLLNILSSTHHAPIVTKTMILLHAILSHPNSIIGKFVDVFFASYTSSTADPDTWRL